MPAAAPCDSQYGAGPVLEGFAAQHGVADGPAAHAAVAQGGSGEVEFGRVDVGGLAGVLGAGGAGLQGGGGVAVAAQDLARRHRLALHVAGVGAVATVNERQDSMKNQALAFVQRAQAAIDFAVNRVHAAYMRGDMTNP